jgi:hypothetical protein
MQEINYTKYIKGLENIFDKALAGTVEINQAKVAVSAARTAVLLNNSITSRVKATKK